jgi:hypothetical protein
MAKTEKIPKRFALIKRLEIEELLMSRRDGNILAGSLKIRFFAIHSDMI